MLNRFLYFSETFCSALQYNVSYDVLSLCQNIRDLTPLTHEVISRQATINIGMLIEISAVEALIFLTVITNLLIFLTHVFTHH